MRFVVALTFVLVAGCGAGGSVPGPAPTSPPPTAAPTAVPTSLAPSPSSSTPSPTGSPTVAALPQWLSDGVVTRLPTDRHVVALTFDGGSGSQGAAHIVATLLAHHARATFFLTGAFVRANAPLVVSLDRDGFLIGNHTMSHPHMNELPASELVSEVRRSADMISQITGKPPRPWFRFPFGEYDATTLRAIHRLGYGAIGWTVDSRGWQGRAAGTAADVVERVRDALEPGAIVLMHLGANPDDGTTFDADALSAVIDTVRAAGYDFVTLADWSG